MDLVYSPSVCLLLAAAVFILLYALRDRMRRPAKNFPSGPPSLPVIGHLHMINLKRPSDALMKMSRTHGNIFRIQMGTVEMVVLAGYEAVKEALIDNAEVFSERPFVPVFEDMHQGYGIPFSHGDNWKEMRRFTLSTFRDFGMGKRTIEDKIIEECGFLIKEIEVYKDEPVELKEFISVAVGNIISSIVLGHRFDNYQHPTLLRVLELVHENFRLLGSPSVILYNIFPIMRFFPGDHKKIMKNLEELHCFLRETFLKHLKVLERDDQRGYIDAYLVRQLEEKGNPKSYFHEQNLLSILATLFAAGTDTTIASIRWAISFMVKNPLIQKRVHEEIDRVIGSSQPQFHHRKSMPYTNAVVHETQRVANVVPMNLPHATTRDINFRGYHLPKISKTHGNIFRIQMGTVEMVVLAGYEAVKEALIDNAEAFAGRPFVPILDDIFHGYGIPFSNGENWKEMRRFTISRFRDFGVGKRTMEDKITEESVCLIKEMEVLKDEPVELTPYISVAVGNIIASIVLGHRFDDYKNPTLLRVLQLTSENLSYLGSPSVLLYNVFPILRFFPGDRNKLLKNLKELHCFLRETFMKHLKVLERDDQRGYIDAFLVKQLEEKENSNSYFHEKNLICILVSLFSAGTDTTIASIRWALTFMVKNPHIQQRVHEEIDRVIGSSQPQFHHRTSMPYTNAVVHETQRVANVVPMNLPHATTTDVNFRGYHLPKGTYVVPLLESVLFDKTQFERAEEFYPEHFLDSDGKFVMRPAFLPFSTGKRICIGETLAKMEVFIFFTTLMQKFSFHAPPGEPDIEIKRGIGLTSPPLPQKLCIVRRS
uniref:Cytochrome P450 2K1 n=1 Tax=Xenopus tropicalis TaxID=8364 RepID=A0A6I8SB94_XENTR